MNIFVVDLDPTRAATCLCDKHVVKMILETAQLLCTAHDGTAPYKPTHKKHPCTIWTSASMGNYMWLCEHGLSMCAEYGRRYGKTHKSEEVILWCKAHPPNIPDLGLTPFAQAMPDEFKNADPVIAYRNYYRGAKARIAAWKHGNVPSWWDVAHT